MDEFYEEIYDKKTDQNLSTSTSANTFRNPITNNAISLFFEGVAGMWTFTIGPSDDDDLDGFIHGLVTKHQTASRSYWSCKLLLEDRANKELTRVRGGWNAVPDDLKVDEITDQTRLGAILASLYSLNEQNEINEVVQNEK
jgi:hypothetical protein